MLKNVCFIYSRLFEKKMEVLFIKFEVPFLPNRKASKIEQALPLESNEEGEDEHLGV